MLTVWSCRELAGGKLNFPIIQEPDGTLYVEIVCMGEMGQRRREKI
jgi:hypothetical protein